MLEIHPDKLPRELKVQDEKCPASFSLPILLRPGGSLAESTGHENQDTTNTDGPKMAKEMQENGKSEPRVALCWFQAPPGQVPSKRVKHGAKGAPPGEGHAIRCGAM
ncbi:hypothetical protein C8034_v008890 [Colletotrichum sidae]|uniref:Uncharacterized protein n=1 Tax=Colletotrichum sidae TaxID=1347389 RepID=A0A4R8T264_9PEZI|nr:hypothetical protein C8034_v008890 [Colletotrichum sidae]